MLGDWLIHRREVVYTHIRFAEGRQEIRLLPLFEDNHEIASTWLRPPDAGPPTRPNPGKELRENLEIIPDS